MNVTENAGHKYALLLLGDVLIEKDLEFAPDVDLITTTLSELVDRDRTAHWERWLGELAWRDASTRQSMLLTRVPTDRPGVLDADNQKAIRRLEQCWYGLHLAEPRIGRPTGPFRYLSGASADTRRLADVRSTGEFRESVQALCLDTAEYHEHISARPDPWIERWRAADASLSSAGGLSELPILLGLGLQSFAEGREARFLEFRIPAFVRAAESVVALPSGSGKKQYASRVRAIANHLLDGHSFLRWRGDRVGLRLQELFDIRSKCVHGMAPFDEMMTASDAGRLHAARYEYAAELVARELLLWAIRHPRRDELFRDRGALEQAWAQQTPPS